jgi:dihydroxyacetone kinase
MKGFSLTAIVLEESIEKALLTEVETSNWPTPSHRVKSVVYHHLSVARVEFQPSANALVAGIVELITTTLSDLESSSQRAGRQSRRWRYRFNLCRWRA